MQETTTPGELRDAARKLRNLLFLILALAVLLLLLIGPLLKQGADNSQQNNAANQTQTR